MIRFILVSEFIWEKKSREITEAESSHESEQKPSKLRHHVDPISARGRRQKKSHKY
jgi:hypothetical protein